MSQPPEHNLPSEQDGYTGHSLDILGRELFATALSWSTFWTPRFTASSSALIHLPYLFWLIENHAPQRVVQLGVGDGVAYLAACQTIDNQGSNAACRGISLLGGQGVDPAAVASNDSHYRDFSTITTEKLATAHRHFRSGGIDLLIINLPLDEESAAMLSAKWNDLLSERGLIVVLDSKTKMAEKGAGAWLDPLLDTHPGINLDQGEGLLTLLVGKHQDSRIARLADLELGMPGHQEARQIFRRLGESIVARQNIHELRTAHEGEGHSLAEARDQLARARRDLSEARAAEDRAHHLLATIQADIFDLKSERADLQTRLAEAEAASVDLKRTQAIRAELEARLEAQTAEARELAREIERASAVHERDEEKLTHAEYRLAQSEQARQEAISQAKKHEQNFSEERDQMNRELASKSEELALFDAKYKERLVDIAELGRAIASKESDLAQIRAQHENSELHRHVAAQLSRTRMQVHTALNQKIRLRRNWQASNEIAEDIRLVEASELFDPEWYLAFYPDVAEARTHPARHFVTDGAYELRNPGPNFDSLKYHRAYPDVTAAQFAGFIHYVRHGRAEKRQTFPVGERG